jgi:hypothetical protein
LTSAPGKPVTLADFKVDEVAPDALTMGTSMTALAARANVHSRTPRAENLPR